MILVINNRDSFVFNLDRYLRLSGAQTRIIDAQSTSLEQVQRLAPNAIIVSPGPCTPDEAGISQAVVKTYSGRVPILGVCLGHQVIGQVFGAKIGKSKSPMYGRASMVEHCETGLFEGLNSPLKVGLYHSLVVQEPVGDDLIIEARSPTGEIMAVRHATHPTYGVQFHPESILSEDGFTMLKTFLQNVVAPA
ncbi:MAG: aminodeoxychorismate/anthranilate synthase component II [Henriciella sp.]